MQTSDMLAAMALASVTQGWDAICALHIGDVNALLLNAYAYGGGPVTMVKAIKISTTISGQGPDIELDLDLQVGPPLIIFGTGAQASTAMLSMWVTSGTITVRGPGPAITLELAANSVQIGGTVSLSQMNGRVTNGYDVVLDLTTGTFSVAMTGLGTPTEEAVGAAITQYFAQNNTKYPLGTVSFTGNPEYPSLIPTSFSFGSQTDPDGDQCLLIFITTSGTPGQAATISLPGGVLPIPDGYTAALFISAGVLFKGVLAPQFTGAMAATGLTGKVEISEELYMQNMQPSYYLGVTPGSFAGFEAGELTGSYPISWYSWQPVMIPMTGLNVGPTGQPAGVAGSCSANTTMLVCVPLTLNPEGEGQYIVAEVVGEISIDIPVALQASVEAGGAGGQEIALAVTPGTMNVTVALNPDTADNQDLFGPIFAADNTVTTSELVTHFGAALSAPLGKLFGFDFTPFSVFALTNLLFGDQAAMLLGEAYMPCDLLVIGTVAECFAVTPAIQWVLPGSRLTLSAPVAAAQGQRVSWTIYPMTGTIGADTGVYIAPGPAGLTSNQVVVVTATATAGDGGAAGTGTGIIIVAAPLVVNPAQAALPPGQSVQFFASQMADAQQEMNWSIAPAIGQIGSDGTYTAPPTLTSPQTVTVTASMPRGGQSATATVQLQPPS